MLVDQFDQLPEPRAGHDHVGGGKSERQPLGRFQFSAGISFEGVVAELRDGESRLGPRIGPQLDKIRAAVRGAGAARGTWFFGRFLGGQFLSEDGHKFRCGCRGTAAESPVVFG